MHQQDPVKYGAGAWTSGSPVIPLIHQEPCSPENDAAQVEPAMTRAPLEVKVVRVVLADDHRILRQGLVLLLSGEPDIEVVAEAANGQEAVDLTRRFQPSIVVMDVTMPVLNGIEATRRITAEMPEVRVIGLSMHESADMDQAMRDAGAAKYLPKGGPLDDLVDAIRELAQDPPPETESKPQGRS